MRTRGWHSYLLTVAVLALQVSVSVLGTIGVCVDRPHTHGGVPAPDCLMHHAQPESTAPETSSNGNHHQHEESSAADTARLACSCSSDPLTLVSTEIAVVPIDTSDVTSDLVVLSSPELTQSAPDVRLVPLSPPPKPSIA
jgi:hypothetical protein